VKERLRLVTDFAELRAGMIVVAGPCRMCGGGSHRGILMSLGESLSGKGMVYPMAPVPSHSIRYVICRQNVDEGRVRIVEDGLEDTQTTSTSTPAPSRKKARA
jgi:hypothetical protein